MSELHLVSDLDNAQEMRQSHPVGSAMAGSHLETSFSEWLHHRYQGQVEWKNLLREMMLGNGIKYDHCDEVPADIYYVPPEQMNLDMPLFVGSQTPSAPRGSIVCVIDTSRSVSVDMLKLFLGELQNLLEHEDVQQSHLYLTSADSTMRGEVMHFSPEDLNSLPEKLLLHGRGGTNIGKVICDAINWMESDANEAGSTLEALVYFSDLLDKPPARASLPAELPKIAFLTPPSLSIRSFRNKVADYAIVAEIRESTIIDLCQN